MRCLYCGKELALLKRWTGGGEFCSDGHRQRYQEEYNQLALNRLLQAKPPSKRGNEAPAKPSQETPVSNEPAPQAALPESASLTKPAFQEIPQPMALAVREETPAPEPEPETIHEELVPEVAAPADMVGFLVDMPDAAPADVPQVSRPDMEFLHAIAAALPDHSFEPLDSKRSYQLETAGLLTFQPSNRASNYSATGSRDRRLEVRDFVRTDPVVEINLSPAGETGLETSSEAMDILILPRPPQGSPLLWQQPPLGFSAAATELGDLARLRFATTGFDGQGESNEEESREGQSKVDAGVNAAVAVEEPRATIPHFEVEVHLEPAVEAPVVETIAETAPAAVAAEPAVPEVVEDPVPEPVVKPLPLTLHATAPGKGKPVQVFSSAPKALSIQVPRSSSPPLRATMTVGPAPAPARQAVTSAPPSAKIETKIEPKKPVPSPAPVSAPAPVKVETKVETKIETKTEPRKPVPAPAPVRPDPRVAAPKPQQPETKTQPDVKEAKKPLPVRVPEPVKQVAKTEPNASKPPAAPAAKVDVKLEKKPEIKEPVKPKEEAKPAKPEPAKAVTLKAEPPKPEPPKPEPIPAPFSGSSDLGLPRLNTTSPGLLGQIPMVVRIAIVLVLLAGIGIFIAFSTKSGGAASASSASTEGSVVAGSPLPAGDAGWISDWGAEQGVRRTRQISILRSSQTLTDYRLEMQAQIDTKAVGWIFRAADPKNFYVTKLEIVKPGLEPTIALVRFAIVGGEEQVHAQLPLTMKVRRDTMFKIRFDAIGNHFTTYVQDQKVDDWHDDRVKTGGVGLYSDRGEVASLKGGMNVVPLMIRK